MQPGARGTEGRSSGIRRDGLPAFARVGRRFDHPCRPGLRAGKPDGDAGACQGRRADSARVLGRSGRGRRGAKAHPAAAATAQPPAQGAGRKGTFQPEQAGRVREAPSGPRASRSRRRPSYQTVSGMAFSDAQRPALGKKKAAADILFTPFQPIGRVGARRAGAARFAREPLFFHAARRS